MQTDCSLIGIHSHLLLSSFLLFLVSDSLSRSELLRLRGTGTTAVAMKQADQFRARGS